MRPGLDSPAVIWVDPRISSIPAFTLKTYSTTVSRLTAPPIPDDDHLAQQRSAVAVAATNVPSPATVSLSRISPTLPCQLPTMAVEYAASELGC